MEGVTSTTFVKYILGKVDNSPAAWQRAYESLRLHPSQLSSLTAGKSERERFIHRFDRYAERVIHFLNHTPQQTSGGRARAGVEAIEKKRSIGAIITGHLLSDLLSPSFSQVWNNDSLFELTIITLQFAHAEHLRHIANQLSNCPGLLGKIVSSDKSSQLLGPWIQVLRTQNPNTTTLEAWTEIIADACSACPLANNHGLEATLEQWETVQMVRRSLRDAGFHGTGGTGNPMAGVSYEVRKAIDDLMPKTKRPPGSRQVTVATLQYIEVEATLSILSKLCNSMPCRRCFARFRNPSYGTGNAAGAAHPIPEVGIPSEIEQDHLGLDDELFNQGIGLWKILLSAQALKDLQSSKSQGSFHLVWGKLQELSTGDWIRKSVAHPFKVATGAPDFKVRLFIAHYCKTSGGGILWQVDCAFDCRVRSHSQVVKVWRIGTSEEVVRAAEVVAQTQRQWSEAHVARCKENQVDKAMGIKVPALFAEDLPQKDPEDDVLDAGALTKSNLLISNKFHALTNRVFDNVLYGDQYAEFPYDPNSVEVTIIKHFETAAFILGRSGTGKTTCLLYKLLSRYLASRVNVTEEKEHCQILVTRSKELTEKLQHELGELIKAQLLNTIQTRAPPVDTEPAEKWNGATEQTEKTLFALKQYRFPLVCTFSHLLRLIENSIIQNDKENYAVQIRDTVSDFVDFHFFKSVYWPKLASYGSLPGVHLDAGVVFSEIMGVIKGSASTRNGLKPLSRDAYITRSPNLAPIFPTPAARSLLFDLYSQYEDRKRERGDEDAIDRMIKIIHGIRRYGLDEKLQDVIHEIYVDEVQDQRPLELELFLHLVKSPRGVHFAGDSAQCISNDTAFRFANVKALFFDHYAKTEYELAKPTLFPLSRNYRSRKGILKFSSFIMGLLWKGFPTVVDKLDPEIGEIPGPKPIIFVGERVTELLVEASCLAHVGGDNDDTPDTGKRSNKQVVIVRDDGTRSHLQSLLDGKRMAYTILETKGMEYDDVFIFNFFQSSPCLDAMRTLEQLLPDRINDTYAAKNMIMCSELKNLYVAITRPCNRLWMLENATSSVIEILTKLPKPLVEIKYLDTLESLSQLANTLRPLSGTTALDWIRSGKQCMEKGLYDRALQCFKNAGDSRNEKLAEAYLLQQSGREQKANGDTQLSRSSLKKAAKLFEQLEEFAKCAECLEGAGEHVEAAKIWSSIGDHKRAARLFEGAGSMYVENAATEYFAADCPQQALSLLHKAKHYESLINRLSECHEEIDDVFRKELAIACNQYVRHPETKIAKPMRIKAFRELFINDKERKEYLLAYRYYTELVEFGASTGEFGPTIWRLVLDGQLETILQLSQRTEENWPWPADCERFLDQVYRAIKKKPLFRALNAGKDVPDTVFTIETEFAAATWAKRWNLQINSCRDILARSALPCKQPLEEGTIELVSFLILAKPEYFTEKATSLSQLRCMFEYLQKYMQLLKPLETDALPSFPEPTISCLGLIKNPWGPESISYCSSWSILRQRPEVRATNKEFGWSQILREAHKCLCSLMPTAADKILNRASGDPILNTKIYPCRKCVTKGPWSPLQNSRVQLCHQLMSYNDYLTQFQNRVRWWQLRVGFTYNLLSPKSNSLLATEADLGQQLQHFFSYRSAFLQNSAVMGEAVKKILHDIPLLRRFQSLSRKYISIEIQRLQPQQEEADEEEDESEIPEIFWDQGHLSALIKGYRLLYTFYPSSIQAQLDKLEISHAYSVDVFQHYDQFKRLAQSEFNFATTVSIVYRLQGALDAFITSRKLYSYDATIISMYEEIATLLLFLGWPEQVITPNSWRDFYLKQWMKPKVLILLPPFERRAFQYLLYRLMLSFCEMIRRLESQVNKGLNAILQALFVRRSVDLLLIIVLNFSNLNPRPSFCWMLDAKVQEVLRIPALRTGDIYLRPPSKLLVRILRAFKLYNSKDHLNVYLCEKASSEKASSEKASSEKASSEKASSEKASSEKASSEKASSEKASGDKASSDKASSDKASSDKASSDKASSDKASSDKASSDKASSEKASSEKASSEKASSEKASSDRLLARRKTASNLGISIQPRPTCVPNHNGCQSVATGKGSWEWNMEVSITYFRAGIDSMKSQRKAAKIVEQRYQKVKEKLEQQKKNADPAQKGEEDSSAVSTSEVNSDPMPVAGGNPNTVTKDPNSVSKDEKNPNSMTKAEKDPNRVTKAEKDPNTVTTDEKDPNSVPTETAPMNS